MQTMRRLGAAVLVVVLLASGCASRSGSSSPEPTAGGTPAAGSFPATVEHKFGSITVEAAPDRVVSVGFKEQDWLYEFGVSPVGVRDWYDFYDHEINPWAADLVQGEPPTVLGAELDVEQVAALRPDLIVAVSSGITQEQYDQLSEIAPTLAGPRGSEDFTESWRDVTRLVGAALGKPDRADEIIGEIEAAFTGARQEHPQLVGAEVAVWSAWASDSTGIYSSGDPRPQLLSELGLVPPPEADELTRGESWAPVGEELVGDSLDLADDAVVVIGGSSSSDDPGARGVLTANPTFATSRSQREGRVVFVDTNASDVALSFGSPLSIRYTLAHLAPQLAAAVDGDPATEVPTSPGD